VYFQSGQPRKLSGSGSATLCNCFQLSARERISSLGSQENSAAPAPQNCVTVFNCFELSARERISSLVGQEN
jgi:hypothetical protein